MIRRLSSGKYRLYSRKVNPKTGRRRNLGTFGTRAAAERHERATADGRPLAAGRHALLSALLFHAFHARARP